MIRWIALFMYLLFPVLANGFRAATADDFTSFDGYNYHRLTCRTSLSNQRLLVLTGCLIYFITSLFCLRLRVSEPIQTLYLLGYNMLF